MADTLLDFSGYGKQTKTDGKTDFSSKGKLSDIDWSAAREWGGAVADRVRRLYKTARGMPEGFDPSGVADWDIRGRLGYKDNQAEALSYLESVAGKGQVVQDPAGRYALTPQGMLSAGLPPSPQGLPTLVEEPGLTRYDVADIMGDIPVALGALGGGLMASGMGFIPGMAAAAAGAGLGKLAGEAGEGLLGWNEQPTLEVLGDVTKEAAMGGASEIGYRGLIAPFGRAIMAPGAPWGSWWSRKPWMDPEKVAIAETARRMDIQPSISNITRHPLYGRIQQQAEQWSGNAREQAAAQKLQREMLRLKKLFGKTPTASKAGQSVKDAITEGRRKMGDWADEKVMEIEELTGGGKVFLTRGLKEKLKELTRKMPKTKKGGEPIGLPEETLKEIKKLGDVQDAISFEQWQRMRTDVQKGIERGTLMPGVKSADRGEILEAIDQLPEEAIKYKFVTKEAASKIRDFRAQYARLAGKHKDEVVQKLVKDTQFRGTIRPDQVVSEFIRPGELDRAKVVMRLLPKDTKDKVRHIVMSEIVDSVKTVNPKDVTKFVFKGSRFLDELDKEWSRKMLNEVFGKKHADALFDFAKVQALLSEKQAMIAGLAINQVAMHPWRHLDRQIQWNVFEKAMASEPFVRYLTEGIKAPGTRKAMDALSRAALYSQTMMDDETSRDLLEEPIQPSAQSAE